MRIQSLKHSVVICRRIQIVGVFYNWEPSAHFGIYRPDTFWFAEE